MSTKAGGGSRARRCVVVGAGLEVVLSLLLGLVVAGRLPCAGGGQ